MKSTSLWLLLALTASLLTGCKNPSPVRPGDGGPGDGGPGDGGLVVTVLRETLNIDLAQVDSFYVVSGTTAMSKPDPDSPVPRGYRKEGENPQLYALTLTGEVLAVSMVEGSDGTTGGLAEPIVKFIFPTASWIFFATDDFRVHKVLGDGTTLEIGCNTIAARREDDALFCSELRLRSDWGSGSPSRKSILSNAAGDIIYVMTQGALQSVLYRLDMNGLEGPMATLIDSVAAVQMFQVNATGDLLVSHYGPTFGSTTLVTQIIPAEGGDASTLALTGGCQGCCEGLFVAGTPGTADEDSFYLLDGRSQFGYFPTTLRVLTKTGASFTDTSHDLAEVPDTMQCGFLHQLTTGAHMLCGGRIAKVVEDASVLEEPVVTPFEHMDRLIDVWGLPMRFAPGFVVLHAGEGSVIKFLRHDGAVQQDIPIDPNIALIEFIVSPGGAIDFMGVNTNSNEKVIGAVPAGETEVTILSAEGIDTEQVVTFTRIN